MASQNQATRLVAIADELYTFGQSTAGGELYAYPKGDPAQARRLEDIRPDLAAVFAAEAGTVPNAKALGDAMTVLAGRARAGERRGDLTLPTDTGGGSVADALVTLAEDTYTLGAAVTGEPYAVPIDGPYVARMLRGGRLSVRAELARRFFDTTGRAASSSALADAMLVLEGKAAQAEPLALPLRVAAVGERQLVLDLGDEHGRAVTIDKHGWKVVDRSPVLFRRTELTGALPVPAAHGDLDPLWEILNLDKEDRPLLLAWLVAALFPDLPHPIGGLLGEQGSGKTTAGKVVTMLLDPGPVPVRKPPRDADGWVTAAAGSWVVCLDNVSDLPDWLSDSLCRAVTGDGDVRRQLYTDGGLVVFSFRRCIIITGIDLGAVRGDFADRLLPLDLALIGAAARVEESTFWPVWADKHPTLLAGLLDLTVKVLAAMPTVVLADKPRMADFARVLAAVDAVMGTAGIDRYRSRAGALAADSLTGDPFIVELAAAFARAVFTAELGSPGAVFEGPSADLLAAITPKTETWKRPKDWPGNARAVTALLKRQAPVMRRAGWTADQLPAGHGNVIRWRITPPTDMCSAAETEKARNPSSQPSQPSPPATDDPLPASVARVASVEPGASLSDGGTHHHPEPDPEADPCPRCGWATGSHQCTYRCEQRPATP